MATFTPVAIAEDVEEELVFMIELDEAEEELLATKLPPTCSGSGGGGGFCGVCHEHPSKP
ncbi:MULTISPECIES: hypothetical protein [unclassified Streptomyces]|uniref:hypothetical protein n=1 Tax=unclassified Streptomyces TaxID=2593676 RepID=UPI000F5BFAAE|nr:MULTISPECIES: hypothetical protein [unclassified Streptomyces]MCX4394180.1 hypothetical protein [Streptomyces sp. NBC_01767]RPK76449.1 hypothetical protein EES42_03405 [Streptomyces sp. ADI95-17]WSC27910.1 hypothetical protein OG902_15060 [Streptomyces sp. NBC_01768]WSX03788.1 hypothetical protein OG355_27095 [Streptomyces sp. NBC_00987]